jgi:hypothetical protein
MTAPSCAASDHESPLSPFIQTPPALWPGLLTGLPAALEVVADEPAFTLVDVPMVTVALWRLTGDDQWHHGQIAYPQAWEHQHQDPDGSDWLFVQLDGRAESYLRYASNYFGRDLPPRSCGLSWRTGRSPRRSSTPSTPSGRTTT